MKFEFKAEFKKISSIIEKNCGIKLEEENYDALIIKPMTKSDCINNNDSDGGKRTHIAITGDQRNIFPFINQDEYMKNDNKKLMNFFIFKAPVNIYAKNYEYLYENKSGNKSENKIDFNGDEKKKVDVCISPSKRNINGKIDFQIKLSRIYNDSPSFIDFRNVIEIGDFFIVLKFKERLEYDTFAMKKSDMSNDYNNKAIVKYNIEGNNNKKSIGITFVNGNNINYNNINKEHQRIFFGAPGTGKSYKLKKETNYYFDNNYERVTFHPNYMYGNFVGAFKPFPEDTGELYENGNPKKAIAYKYVPGPLMRILVKALNNPYENYLLLIEEINRANTAAVFGDFFQLLDRNELGESEYPITISEEVKLYLKENLLSREDIDSNDNVDESVNEEDIDLNYDIDDNIINNIENKIGKNYERLILPSNLYIWATMNSSDQGVKPMDTAFKRRWDFTYIGINEALKDDKIREEFKKYKFEIKNNTTIKTIEWNDFRVRVNKGMSKCNIPEDKLIGPYFISKSILETKEQNELTEIIKNKVLMYIYEDAGKPYRNKLFKKEMANTYSELCENFDSLGMDVFNEALIKIEDNKINEEELSESKDDEDNEEKYIEDEKDEADKKEENINN